MADNSNGVSLGFPLNAISTLADAYSNVSSNYDEMKAQQAAADAAASTPPIPTPMQQAAPAPVDLSQLGANIELPPAPAAQQQPAPTMPPTPAQFLQTPEGQKAVADGGFSGLQDSYDKIYKSQVGATKAVGDAGKILGEFEAGKFAEQAKQMETLNTQNVERNQRFEAEQADAQKSLNQSLDEYKAISAQKVDPNHFWQQATPGTGSKIAAAISIALAGIGGAVSGKGGNAALDIFDRAIDRDIDAQKFNIQQQAQGKRSEIDAKNMIYGRMLDKYKNADQAEAATRLHYLQQTELQIKSQAAKFGGTQAQSNATMAIGQIQMAQQGQKMVFAKAAQEAALINANGAVDWDRAPMKLSDGRVKVPGYGYTSEKYADEFNKSREKFEPALSQFEKINDLVQRTKGATDLTSRRKIAAELAQLAAASREAILGPGTVQPAEYERLIKLVGNPNANFDMLGEAAINFNALRDKTQRDFNLAVKRYGLPAPKEYTNTVGRPSVPKLK